MESVQAFHFVKKEFIRPINAQHCSSAKVNIHFFQYNFFSLAVEGKGKLYEVKKKTKKTLCFIKKKNHLQSVTGLIQDTVVDSLTGLWWSHLQPLLAAHLLCSVFAYSLVFSELYALQNHQGFSISLCQSFCCFAFVSKWSNAICVLMHFKKSYAKEYLFILMRSSGWVKLSSLAVLSSVPVQLYHFHWLANMPKPYLNHFLSYKMFLCIVLLELHLCFKLF